MKSGPYLREKTSKKLPPNQHPIERILRWSEDHPDINPDIPKIDRKDWILTVGGAVEKGIELYWEDFATFPMAESTSDFHCVEGWSVLDCQWEGVLFETVAKAVKPHKDARFVYFECYDGYSTSLPVKDLLKRYVLLAYRLNDADLDYALGGPVRLVVPSKYAYKSAMWIKQISFIKEKRLGYWEERGYSDTADPWKNDRFAKRR